MVTPIVPQTPAACHQARFGCDPVKSPELFLNTRRSFVPLMQETAVQV